jgi:adenylosuccinate synthase
LPTELTGARAIACARAVTNTAPSRDVRAAAGGTTRRDSLQRPINGLDALALTKLDVLDGLGHVDICTSCDAAI